MIDRLYEEFLEKVPEDDFQPVNQVNRLLEDFKKSGYAHYLFNTQSGEMLVEYKKANKRYFYAPYFTNYQALDNIDYKQDLYTVPEHKKKAYMLTFSYFDTPQEMSNMTNKIITDNPYYSVPR